MTVCVLARPYAWGEMEAYWIAASILMYGFVGWDEWTSRKSK
jgi:hypothetical protein